MNIKSMCHRSTRDKFTRNGQSGVALLEALIAILIFSLGILTIVGIQATSIRLTGDAQLRTRASLLAERLIAQMWVHGGNIAGLKTDFQAGGAAYTAWLAEVKRKDTGLPGVVAADEEGAGSTLPTVTVGDDGQVVVTLFWKTPALSAADPARQHIVTTNIVRNN